MFIAASESGPPSITALNQYLHKDDHLRAFLLVDPYAHEPLMQAFIEEFPCETFCVPLKFASFKGDQLPRLIQLNPKSKALVDESAALMLAQQTQVMAGSSSICGWLRSEACGAVIARHLAACMERTFFEGNRWWCLRWQDCRVLEWIWPALSPRQKTDLLGPIVEWWALDRRGKLRQYSSATPRALPTGRPGFLLDATQRTHVRQCALAQTIISGWLTFSPELPPDYLQRVEDILTLTTKHALGKPEDVALLAAYSLQVHLRLLAHPKIHALIHQSMKGAALLSTLLGAVSDVQWEAMRAELDDIYFDAESSKS
ncbi:MULTISPECIES: DUF4123 domain-containing protein [unclassified Pseudomonas]|uniref:DUF4123 domain-containing protein n=1 Tax=unclassified Pseudomonas TaxID=196821 RepID=UPI002499FCE3|nr:MULTISPECIES: DUF4123 domain-containing protein [unclassified Pseudomonas]MDI3247811.1 DUF4123 domain-containing protein [Pseudomonas sp. AL10]MDI3263577.1 DUF4123 domain-containing protein [Pseudomonas sp. AL15]